MPQLNWTQTDLVECLETMPTVGDYEVKHGYVVQRDSVVLTVVVRQYESVIELSLRQTTVESPTIEFALFVRGAVRYIKDKRGEYLEIEDCVIAPNRFSYQDRGNMFDRSRFSHGLTVQLIVKPHIQIKYFVSESHG